MGYIYDPYRNYKCKKTNRNSNGGTCNNTSAITYVKKVRPKKRKI